MVIPWSLAYNFPPTKLKTSGSQIRHGPGPVPPGVSVGMGDIWMGWATPLSMANSWPPSALIAGQLGKAWRYETNLVVGWWSNNLPSGYVKIAIENGNL